jgi:hypothetical protein
MVNHPSLDIYCDPVNQDLPLIDFQYLVKQFWICPQRLPILKHIPDHQAGKCPSLLQRNPTESHA